MYIDLNTLFWGFIGILLAIAIIFLIIALIKFTKLINNINDLIVSNKTKINNLCSSLPEAAENIVVVSENLKDVSDVVTETTADVIVAKENLTNNFETVKDIIDIIVKVFSKNK
ncbi:hypothetical protein SAMN02745163_00075 [Clostridium cavendishii DSM 21758]|uniref:Uncharacterized protein n=1 Tax=Clostridium cavendishii DSM 21758 TaxID=1121302 RepID=A0A1M6AG07_9CLOT|nr:hypothetical protein [Clostridium cavendishii]SHI35476.1 hypothetical protein SAMN02745163_00075 [Clostridium cavendishii DSM 21758]